jgi:hypothetical protein
MGRCVQFHGLREWVARGRRSYSLTSLPFITGRKASLM